MTMKKVGKGQVSDAPFLSVFLIPYLATLKIDPNLLAQKQKLYPVVVIQFPGFQLSENDMICIFFPARLSPSYQALSQ